jgi:hypothetical protein
MMRVDGAAALGEDPSVPEAQRGPRGVPFGDDVRAVQLDGVAGVLVDRIVALDREVGEDVGQMLPENIPGGWVLTNAVKDV